MSRLIRPHRPRLLKQPNSCVHACKLHVTGVQTSHCGMPVALLCVNTHPPNTGQTNRGNGCDAGISQNILRISWLVLSTLRKCHTPHNGLALCNGRLHGCKDSMQTRGWLFAKPTAQMKSVCFVSVHKSRGGLFCCHTQNCMLTLASAVGWKCWNVLKIGSWYALNGFIYSKL